jgi:hypothetical protein
MAGTITVTGASSSEPTGQRVLGPSVIQGRQVIGETLAISLTAGDNTVTIPANAVAAWIQAPINGNATISVRTNLNSTDAGLPINETGSPFIYPFPSAAPASLIIKASSGEAAFLSVVFI